MLRIDVSYMKPGDWWEVGLVDHKPGEEPKHPTLFISALCPTRDDYDWLMDRVNEIVHQSEKR
jgi:hypothetical protein